MSKKPRKRNKQEAEAFVPDDDELPLAFDPVQMQRLMDDLQRFIAQQEFDSPEELDAFLAEFMASDKPIPPFKPRTPLEKAQAVIYDAWEAETPQKRARLARKALSLSKDCADAYVLLGNDADDAAEALAYYEEGVAAGTRALGGPEKLAEYKGHFWGAFETRPYMRARQALVEALWYMGELQEAVAHMQEMLQFNPDDNQGVRYRLLTAYLDEGQIEQAEALLEAYEDDPSALWEYTTALLLYGREGASRKATAALRQALKGNFYVADYLLGLRRIPKELPELISFGADIEAMECADAILPFWLQEEGALEWLRRTVKKAPRTLH